MIRYVDYISPEEYMELRKKVGWMEFPIEQAKACIENAYMIRGVRDDGKAIIIENEILKCCRIAVGGEANLLHYIEVRWINWKSSKPFWKSTRSR